MHIWRLGRCLGGWPVFHAKVRTVVGFPEPTLMPGERGGLPVILASEGRNREIPQAGWLARLDIDFGPPHAWLSDACTHTHMCSCTHAKTWICVWTWHTHEKWKMQLKFYVIILITKITNSIAYWHGMVLLGMWGVFIQMCFGEQEYKIGAMYTAESSSGR